MPKITWTPAFRLRPGRLVLLAIAVTLYALPFFSDSRLVALLSLLAIVPVYAITLSGNVVSSILYGSVAGAATFRIINAWLATYHPSALTFVLGLEATRFGIVYGLMSFAAIRRSRFALPTAVFLWVSFETWRSTGFLAYPYGSLPYVWYTSKFMLMVASVGGVTLVGFVTAAANACIYQALVRYRAMADGWNLSWKAARAAAPWLVPAVAVALAIIVAGPPSTNASITGAVRQVIDASQAPAEGAFRVALLQPAVRKQKSAPEYANAFRHIRALNDSAMSLDPDLVVWHETAIVPPVEWHLRHRPDRDVYEFVAGVKQYLEHAPVPVLTGNAWASPDDPLRATEYNSAVLYRNGTPVGRYDKVKLVPFSEYFPYGKLLPRINDWIIKTYGYFWTPGPGAITIPLDGARIAAPVCFEDSFSRHFAAFDKPDFFVVLTNDSWAQSAGMQRQHLAMSVLRAAETGSVVLRAADTGSTAAIAPNGAVVAEIPPFDRDFLLVDVTLGAVKTTVFEAWGKNSDIVIAVIAAVLLIVSLLVRPSIDKRS